jgi:hypothetical protein
MKEEKEYTLDDFVAEMISCEIMVIKCNKCGKEFLRGECSPWDTYFFDKEENELAKKVCSIGNANHQDWESVTERYEITPMDVSLCSCGNALELHIEQRDSNEIIEVENYDDVRVLI